MEKEALFDQMNSSLIETADKTRMINDARSVIKDQLTKDYPILLMEDKKRLQKEIEQKIHYIQSYLDEILPFILKIKKGYVKDIIEETTFCAVYLLMRYAVQNWFSVLSLAKQGDYGSLPLIRVSKEAVALSTLFVVDYHKGENTNITEWFKGEIIDHYKYRKAYSIFLPTETEEETLLFKKMLGRLHHIESLPVHSSYMAILENISPHTEDFDDSGTVQCSRANSGLTYAIREIEAINTSLLMIYSFLLKDFEGADQLAEINLKHNPRTTE